LVIDSIAGFSERFMSSIWRLNAFDDNSSADFGSITGRLIACMRWICPAIPWLAICRASSCIAALPTGADHVTGGTTRTT
jgi:hypothetical protein